MKSRLGYEIIGHGIVYGMPVHITDGGCEGANLFAGLVLDVLIGIFGFTGDVFVYDPKECDYFHALFDLMMGDYE